MNPPDYETTMSQPELYPLPPYIEDGFPSSMTSLSRDETSHSEEDKLPSYEEVMQSDASVAHSSTNTDPQRHIVHV